MKTLPKTAAGWIGLIVVMALAGLTAWQLGAGWIGTTIAVLTALGAAVGVQNIPQRGGPAAPAAVVLTLLLGATGCGHLGAAKRACYGVYKATEATGNGLGALATKAHQGCLAKHGTRTPAYKACVSPWLKRLEAWTGYLRPSAVSTVSTFYGAVRLADAVGGKKANELDWGPLFQAAGCAVYRGLKSWGHLLDDKGGGVLKLLQGLDPVICTRMKTLGVLGTGLELAAQVLAWIRQLLENPTDTLFKAVDDWLRGPPRDAADDALKLIRDNLPPEPARAAPGG